MKKKSKKNKKKKGKKNAIAQPRSSHWRRMEDASCNAVKLQKSRGTGSDQQQQQQHQQQQWQQKLNEKQKQNQDASLPYGDGQQRQQKNRRHRQRCVCLPNNYTPVQFPAVWSELRSNQQLCDGVIRSSDNQSFPVHRAILSAVSPYFKALFTNSLGSTNKKNGNELSKKVIVQLDSPGNILSLILDYTYTGSCRITVENVELLLPLADRLEVLGVVQLCCQFLLKELRPDNCLGIYKFAKHYFCRNLEDRARKYIRQHFKEILQEGSEFRELTCDELEQLLRDDDLNARTEELVFEALKMWVEWRSNERSVYLPRLLSCPRYGLMGSQYFKDNILNWSVSLNQECKDVLLPVAAYFKDRQSQRHSFSRANLDAQLERPRVPYEILFTVGGWTSNSPINFLESYDIRSNRWYLSQYMDVSPRAYHGICTLNNQIYIIGGYEAGKGKPVKYLNTVRCFDPITKKWKERACMYHVRSYVAVCTLDGKIYALGGNSGFVRISSCERYDPVANQWELISPMNWPRSDASAAALNGRIYVVGGYDGFFILCTVEVYDVATDQWSYMSPMSIPRTGLSLVAFKDALYAIGGFDGYVRLSSVEKYDPNKNFEWQEIAEMYIPRSNFAAAVLDDLIFVIGGYDGWLPISYVECYEADSNEWYMASSINVCRSALGACVLTGLDNARDYSYHRQNNTNNNSIIAKSVKNRYKSKKTGTGS